MKNISSQYELLFEKLHQQKERYSEKNLAIFTPAKGTKYQHKLMIVGRAVNGWIIKMDKNKRDDLGRLNTEVIKTLPNSNLNWVNDMWGKTVNKYSTKKSAFWRVAKAIAANLTPSEKQDVVNTIVWSNLYKAAKWEGGNPSTRLMNVQYDKCLELLKLEIELYQPERIVFLTGYNWANHFLTDMGTTRIPLKKYDLVEYTGDYKGVRIIVGQHPQGKPEQKHVKEILSAFEQ